VKELAKLQELPELSEPSENEELAEQKEHERSDSEVRGDRSGEELAELLGGDGGSNERLIGIMMMPDGGSGVIVW
jgi:hypothetical protein